MSSTANPQQYTANPKAYHDSLIPPAVRRNAERAEEIARAAGTPPEGQQEPQQEGQQPQQEPQQEGQQHEPQPEPQPQPRATALKEGEDPNSETWHQKFVSEHGRTQKLRDDVSRLSSEITNLRGVLAAVQAVQPAPQSDPQQTFKSEITQEEVDQWGPDLLAVIEKKAREIAHQQTAELRNQVQQLGGQVQQVGQATAQTARDRMFQLLDGRFTNWRDINYDENFKGWLQDVDELSGEKRHDMLLRAWNTNDASRVAAFFGKFLQETGSAPPPAPQQGNGAAPPQQSKPSLENFAAPGKPRASAPSNGAQPSKPIITNGDIAAHFTAVNTGKYRGHEAKQAAFEAEMHAASTEGRVVAGKATRSFP